MTNPLHDAAMAAKRFHDAALAYLDGPEGSARAKMADSALEELIGILDRMGELDAAYQRGYDAAADWYNQPEP